MFFRNFHPRVEYERNSGLKFFSLFLSVFHPILAKNNTGKLFFNFFAIFFVIFSPGSSMSEIRVEHSLISFLAYLILSNPFLAKTNAGKLFFNFLNFFAVFFLQ